MRNMLVYVGDKTIEEFRLALSYFMLHGYVDHFDISMMTEEDLTTWQWLVTRDTTGKRGKFVDMYKFKPTFPIDMQYEDVTADIFGSGDHNDKDT